MIKMIKILVVFAIMLLLAVPVTAANVTTIEVRGIVFDSGSSTYNTTLQWDAVKFPGFWYALGPGKSSETLKIINQPASSLTANNRVIEKENLQYNTLRSDQKFKVFSEKNKKVENGLEYNSTTKTFKLNATGGYYARLGWFGDLYIAVNGKANKLSKLIKEQKAEEKKTLKLGTSWDLGEGYNLTVQSLDTATNPRQAWLSLSKDGKTLDNRVVNEGEVYTYIEKNAGGESSVPVFVTYVESIFTGAEGMSTFVQLRYTWLISRNVLEIKAGDKFGVFEVKEANENYVLLDNKDNSIILGRNSVQPLYGELKFKVADSSTALRFYPYFEQIIQDSPKVDFKATIANVTAITATSTAYALSSAATTSSQEAGAARASSPLTKPVDTAKSRQWNWIFFAVAGLVATGYMVLRKG